MIRPKLEGKAEEIVAMFLERRIYSSQNELIEAALECLLDRQIEDESKLWDEQSETSEELIRAQVR